MDGPNERGFSAGSAPAASGPRGPVMIGPHPAR